MASAENSKKKELLGGFQRAIRHYDQLSREIARVRAAGEKVTAGLNGMPGTSGPGDKVGLAAAILADLESERKEQLNKLDTERDKVVEIIMMVDGGKPEHTQDLRMVLRWRYIHGLKWVEIAEEMDFAERHVTRLHGEALALLPDAEEIEHVLLCPIDNQV